MPDGDKRRVGELAWELDRLLPASLDKSSVSQVDDE